MRNEVNRTIKQVDYDKLVPKEFTVCKSDEKSWQEVFTTLAEELTAYN